LTRPKQIVFSMLRIIMAPRTAAQRTVSG